MRAVRKSRDLCDAGLVPDLGFFVVNRHGPYIVPVPVENGPALSEDDPSVIQTHGQDSRLHDLVLVHHIHHELDRIDSLRLPEKGRFKKHYTLVTDCLRTYIEKQFQVHAFDRTTTELKVSLRTSSMMPDHARRFIDLFMESDLVKFANLTPEVADAYQLTDQARILVDLTRPAPEPEGTQTSSDENFGVGGSQRPVEVAQ